MLTTISDRGASNRGRTGRNGQNNRGVFNGRFNTGGENGNDNDGDFNGNFNVGGFNGNGNGGSNNGNNNTGGFNGNGNGGSNNSTINSGGGFNGNNNGNSGPPGVPPGRFNFRPIGAQRQTEQTLEPQVSTTLSKEELSEVPTLSSKTTGYADPIIPDETTAAPTVVDPLVEQEEDESSDSEDGDGFNNFNRWGWNGLQFKPIDWRAEARKYGFNQAGWNDNWYQPGQFYQPGDWRKWVPNFSRDFY